MLFCHKRNATNAVDLYNNSVFVLSGYTLHFMGLVLLFVLNTFILNTQVSR